MGHHDTLGHSSAATCVHDDRRVRRVRGDSPCEEEEPVERTEENLWKLTVSEFSGKGSALRLRMQLSIVIHVFGF